MVGQRGIKEEVVVTSHKPERGAEKESNRMRLGFVWGEFKN